jgi:hypothetical protein
MKLFIRVGVPDLLEGVFSYQKYKFRNIMEGLGRENVGIFYSVGMHVYSTFWYTLWKLYITLYIIFPDFGILYQEKSGNPGSEVNVTESLCTVCVCTYLMNIGDLM